MTAKPGVHCGGCCGTSGLANCPGILPAERGRVEELREENEYLLLCVQGLKHWLDCENNAIRGGSGLVCLRCQVERLEAALRDAYRLRYTDDLNGRL